MESRLVIIADAKEEKALDEYLSKFESEYYSYTRLCPSVCLSVCLAISYRLVFTPIDCIVCLFLRRTMTLVSTNKIMMLFYYKLK